MARQLQKSSAFGNWLKMARIAASLSQEELATRVGLEQQYLSRFERKGIVPNDEQLTLICEKLGKSVSEAKLAIARTATAKERQAAYDLFNTAFVQSLVDRAARVKQLDLFVLRADSEHWDELAADQHRQIFAQVENLHISILFRHSDRSIWESFRLLASKLGFTLSDRFHGYYRHPDWEEDRLKEMPMGPPIIVLKDETGASISYYDFDAVVYENELQGGADQAQARSRSTNLSHGTQERASSFVNWIGARNSVSGRLDPKLWVPIPWAE